MRFDYSEFATRNLGFVTQADQQRLRAGRVFVAGVGGMGGACLLSLARAGIGRFTIADIDTFELSNLNRQVFAFLDTIGQDKAEAARQALARINPEAQVEVLGGEWVEKMDELAAGHNVLINGTDDFRASVGLYRAARAAQKTVIDAYASTLPSVICVRPQDPRPEERLGFPTRHKDWRAIDQEDQNSCLLKELEYVMTHSSSADHVDLTIAGEMAAGRRKRFSFAPMVITTGNLMAYEAIAILLQKKGAADYRGYFFNPHRGRVERPLPWPISALKAALVRTYMARLIAKAGRP